MKKTKNDPKISLCMIVKNEENNIRYALDSVKDLADEIIIVDTGSKDKTKDICREYTDKIYDFKWQDDFAVARNESLKHASGDWIIVLDADEVIYQPDIPKIKSLLSNADEKLQGLFVIIVNSSKEEALNPGQGGLINYANYKERIFRRRKEWRYEGALHETNAVAFYGELTKDTDIHFIHYGYHEWKSEKIARNRKSVEKLLKVRGDDDGYALYNLAKQYSIENKKDYIDLLDRLVAGLIAGKIKRTIHLEVVFDLFVSKLLDDKQYEKAKKVAYQWITRIKEYDPRPFFHLGQALAYLEDYEGALKMFETVRSSLYKNLPSVCDDRVPNIKFQNYLYLMVTYYVLDNVQAAKELENFVEKTYGLNVSKELDRIKEIIKENRNDQN